MLRKKLLLLLMMVTLLVSLSQTGGARACSGDSCGCGYDTQACIDECAYGPPAYYNACRHECIRASVRCAIECCGGGGGGPMEF